jgi:hypothetical protein
MGLEAGRHLPCHARRDATQSPPRPTFSRKRSVSVCLSQPRHMPNRSRHRVPAAHERQSITQQSLTLGDTLIHDRTLLQNSSLAVLAIQSETPLQSRNPANSSNILYSEEAKHRILHDNFSAPPKPQAKLCADVELRFRYQFRRPANRGQGRPHNKSRRWSPSE